MKAVILAAGEGTRMRPLTYTRPKVMLPVAGKPILEHVVEALRNSGVHEIILVVGYREDTIRNYFEDGSNFEIDIQYVSQRRQMGTADALRSAIHLIDDDFLMLNGDTVITTKDLTNILQNRGQVMGVTEVENPREYGVMEIEAKTGKVAKIIEKPAHPPSNLINAGVYKFSLDFLQFVEKTAISPRGEFEITDSIQMAIDHGMTFTPVKIENWQDVGYPWDLLKANEIMMSNLKGVCNGEVERGAVVKGEVIIGKGTVILSGSYIVGPVIIGENCTVGPNCFIRPFTTIGDNCHIGAFVEVKNSIIMSNTNIPHMNYIGDSVIGEGCNFGAGTKIANLRLDEKEIKVGIKGRMVNTERRKFGAVIGDNVKTGINVSINTGTVIGHDVFLGPGTKVEGIINPSSKVF